MKYVIMSVWAHAVPAKDALADPDGIYSDHNHLRPNSALGIYRVKYDRTDRSFSVVGDEEAFKIAAEKLQKEFDESCDPVRVYVFELAPGCKPVPVYAAGRPTRYGVKPHRHPADLAHVRNNLSHTIKGAA